MSDSAVQAPAVNRAPHEKLLGWPAQVSGVLGFLAAAVYLGAGSSFLLDDAFIHLAYAKSLALGEGLSYNPGDSETGATSLLWSLLLVPFGRLEDPVLLVKSLGAALHGVAAMLAASLGAQLAKQRAPAAQVPWLSLLCGLLLALAPLQLYAATSGMETALASALSLAALLALATERALAAFVCAFLAPLARPELLVVLVCLGAGWALFERERRCGLALLSGAVLGQASASLYMLAVSGFPFPNTYYVKARSFSLGGLVYWADVVLPREAWLCSVSGLILWARALWLDGRAGRRDLLLFVAASALGLLAVAFSREFKPGVLFWQWRYFAPMLPALALPVAFGLASVPRRIWVYIALVPMLLS
jgi:hypothetical protein